MKKKMSKYIFFYNSYIHKDFDLKQIPYLIYASYKSVIYKSRYVSFLTWLVYYWKRTVAPGLSSLVISIVLFYQKDTFFLEMQQEQFACQWNVRYFHFFKFRRTEISLNKMLKNHGYMPCKILRIFSRFSFDTCE